MKLQFEQLEISRICLRDAIPEIALAATYLDEAVCAHVAGKQKKAEGLIRAANMSEIRQWTESLWGKSSPYLQYRFVANAPPVIERVRREKVRMPTLLEKQLLHARDGYNCRFCRIPLIRKEVRERLRESYPEALLWGTANIAQHAALQAMWVQYDHVLPHARGGTNKLDNILVVCAPCNFGRMNFTLEEVGLADPRMQEPIHSKWGGLERLLSHPKIM